MKAQIWSFDFAISFLIFFLILVPTLFLFNYIIEQEISQRSLDEIETKALAISDSIVRTAGNPADWNATTVRSIGLAQQENILNITKVEYFMGMNYDTVKAVMTDGYDFNLTIKDLNGTVYGTVGTNPVNKTTVPVQRYAKYGDRVVSVMLKLYSY